MSAIRQITIQDPLGSSTLVRDIGAKGVNVIYSDDASRNIEEAFVGTDGTEDGKKGLVPAPGKGDAGKFLSASGLWRDPAGGVTSVNGKTGAVVLKASDLGAVAKASVGVPLGVAELDANGKVPSAQLPSYVDDVIEGYYNTADGKFYEEDTYTTEITPETGKIYVDLSTDTTWRWGGSSYTQISESLALGETSTTAYRGDRGKEAYDHAKDPQAVSAAITEALNKIGVTKEGHVSSATPVTKKDITDLGIPAQDTTYAPIETSIETVQNWYPGSATTFEIDGDKLIITPGVKASLLVASKTVLTGIKASVASASTVTP